MTNLTINITDEERERINAAAAVVVRHVEALARDLETAFTAMGEQMARTIAPAVRFLQAVEEIQAEGRHTRRDDYRRRQLSRRRGRQ
jgi:uncharacterized membrane-anchored protein